MKIVAWCACPDAESDQDFLSSITYADTCKKNAYSYHDQTNK